MTWVEGNKYFGFYKNDKREGFGMYYVPENNFFVGFWKNGKQEGYGKLIQNNKIKYGFWIKGKIDKNSDDMEENKFFNDLDNNNINFCYFKWDVNQLKAYFNVQNKKEN